jgi:penicillin-binding protein A
MGRRIRWLGVLMVAFFGLVIVQLVNIQLVKGKELAESPKNERVAVLKNLNHRGEILAADGTVLAKSEPTPAATDRTDYPYDYVRQYPDGSLYSGITGYDSIFYGVTDIEAEYNSYLESHPQSAQTLSQILFRKKLPTVTDNVTLTVEPKLQQAAQFALSTISSANKDGAIVVLNPKTGAVLAMYSSPSYDPNVLVSPSLPVDRLAYLSYTTPDQEGFFPLRPLATGESFFPGSTMKVITSAAVYNFKPSLDDFNYPVAPCQPFSDSPDHPICNDGTTPANSHPCGGTMPVMLPASCDPGYAELGVQLGVATLRQQAELFGINAPPPIDLPGNSQQPVGGAIESTLKDIPDNSQRLQGDSAIGQKTVSETALQNAMVAAGIANGGGVMTPHLMSLIEDSQGSQVKTYTPTLYKQATSASAAQSVTALMESVTTTGTAAIAKFPPYLCAALKTGTAQTDLGVNHDWMIGFAPANNPQVAIAVVVPYQPIASEGATVAGPIMKYMMEQAIPQGSVQQPCTVQAPSTP